MTKKWEEEKKKVKDTVSLININVDLRSTRNANYKLNLRISNKKSNTSKTKF